MEIDFGTQSRLYAGIFEIELRPWFRRLCPPGSNAFDVGAAEGYHTLALARLSRGGRILAVELDRDQCERLERNVAANPSLRPPPEVLCARAAAVSDPERGRVALDDLAYGGDGFVPDLIKMDVEGKELSVLRGARRILAERRPHLIVETHSRELEQECRELLERHRYRPAVVAPRRWLPEVRPADVNRWLVAEGSPRDYAAGLPGEALRLGYDS
jgi:hypothetical protein